MCELNHSTHAEYPEAMITNDGTVYYDGAAQTPALFKDAGRRTQYLTKQSGVVDPPGK